MTWKHKVKFVLWSIVVALAMTRDELRFEYNAYLARAWNMGLKPYNSKEWLHRRWFPHKYDYEYRCPDCGGDTTSLGLCMDCGVRHDGIRTHARPL